MRRLAWFALLVMVSCAGTPRSEDRDPRPRTLADAHTWVMQLDGVDRAGAVDALEARHVDLIVLEATRTVSGSESFDTAGAVARLSKRSLCLAYVNVGQAESYRPYWIEGEWRAPTADARGFPEFLVTVDPDGWEGNYPVSFWDKRWQARLWGSPQALVDLAIADGFHGVYLDWVLGYREPAVVAESARLGIDPARAMAELVRNLRSYARRKRPGFLVIAQNGGPLAELVPEFLTGVDAVSQEAVHFFGRAGASWDDPEAADQPVPATGDWSTQRYHEVLKRWTDRGVPVFVVEYAAKPENRARASAANRARGYREFQTRAPADRLPAKPSASGAVATAKRRR